MDLRYLQSFVAVVEAGSFAEAARRLDLTPNAVAARLKALEEDLGVVLLKRRGRSVKPTAAGLGMLESARAVLREVRHLRTLAEDGSALGELRLGVFVSAMTSLLPPVLKALYAQRPQLSVYVHPASSVELCRQVAAGELDAAFVVEPQFTLAKHCAWQPLLEEPLVVIAPAGTPTGDAHGLLRSQPFIRYDRSVLGGQLAERYLRDQGLHPQQRLEVDGLMAVAALVDQGLGVALVPDWAPMWRSGLQIVRVPLPGRAPVRRVGLVWALHGPRTPLAEAVLQQAQAWVAQPVERQMGLRQR